MRKLIFVGGGASLLSQKTYKILCVDDEVSVLSSLTRIFKKKFTVLTTETAEAALQVLEEEKDVAVLLTDLHLPQKGGLQLLQEAKSVSPNTVRAILSGQLDLQDMMEAVNKAQIDRFVLKPWENEYLELQMLECLQAHLLIKEKNHLQHLAITDIVTGLTNHRFFQESLQREIDRAQRHSRRLSLVMADVDHFKRFNDSYGHPAGDRALAKLGYLLNNQVRSIDTVSRYGGEEFAIIMPDTEIAPAFEVAERLRKSIEKESWQEEGQNVHVTISLGVSEFPAHGSSASQLIESADQALYEAKKQGRNRTHRLP